VVYDVRSKNIKIRHARMRNALFGEVLCAVVFLAICAVEFASK